MCVACWPAGQRRPSCHACIPILRRRFRTSAGTSNTPINENPELVYLGPTERIGLRLVRERSKYFAPRIYRIAVFFRSVKFSFCGKNMDFRQFNFRLLRAHMHHTPTHARWSCGKIFVLSSKRAKRTNFKSTKKTAIYTVLGWGGDLFTPHKYHACALIFTLGSDNRGDDYGHQISSDIVR